MTGHALCPKCGERFSFDTEFCSWCKTAEIPGGRKHYVRLWHVARSRFGSVFYPPDALNRQIRGSSQRF
jgi:hypothetical protein